MLEVALLRCLCLEAILAQLVLLLVFPMVLVLTFTQDGCMGFVIWLLVVFLLRVLLEQKNPMLCPCYLGYLEILQFRHQGRCFMSLYWMLRGL